MPANTRHRALTDIMTGRCWFPFRQGLSPADTLPWVSSRPGEPQPRNTDNLNPTCAGHNSPAQATADDQPQPGVGPWPGQWPTEPHYDPEKLAEGDHRNVVDKYRYWRQEAIIADLNSSRSGFHIAIENTGHDFNVGSVVRTANAFNAGGVHIVGRRRWNRRGAMVTDRYLTVDYHRTATEFLTWARAEELAVVGVDNLPGSRPLPTTTLPQRCVLVFGEEGPGVSPQLWAECDLRVAIPQTGSTRSVNLGAAAAMVMYHWMCGHHDAFGVA